MKQGIRSRENRTRWLLLGMLLLVGLSLSTISTGDAIRAADPEASGEYVVLAWNDLGMHCYNPDFEEVGVLPPWNTLWAQVVRIGDPPEVVTSGVTVAYAFEDNTYSTGKSDFWDTSPYRPVQNAQWLFSLPEPLPPNVGLTGNGLAGTMVPEDGHFVAEGIPLTEYRDSDPANPYPYQLATVVVYDDQTGQELARTHPVAPVSTEMHCDNCHYDNGPGNEDFATGVVEQNILLKHDDENAGEYPPGHEGLLMDRRPVLCAECHASNALGAPGAPGVPSLSKAIHSQHKEKVPDSLEGCYNCHPGPQTECLRDVMSTEYGMDCVDCHGTMENVSENPEPWLNEPRCDSAGCHGSAYQQDQALYRMSKEHGDIYCAACHDSPHATAPSAEPNDAIKFIELQGHAGTLDTCTVCHATQPAGPGPHGIIETPDKIFVAYISLGYRPVGEVQYDLRGRVSILDEGLEPIAGAQVTAEWQLPNGWTRSRTATTRPDGIAQFRLRSRLDGLYTLTVRDVQIEGHEYDPSMNQQTSEELMVP